VYNAQQMRSEKPSSQVTPRSWPVGVKAGQAGQQVVREVNVRFQQIGFGRVSIVDNKESGRKCLIS